MAKCQSCGNELKKGAKFCASCGAPIGEVEQPVVETVVQNDLPVQVAPVVNPGTELPSDNMGLAGFICGILGITLCCGITSIPALICSVLSMKNVKAGKVKSQTSWMGIAGLVLGILGIVYLVVMIVYFIFFFLVTLASY